MGKKRKQPERSEETQTAEEEENPRPKRTLLGWKAPPQEEKDKENNANDSENEYFATGRRSWSYVPDALCTDIGT